MRTTVGEARHLATSLLADAGLPLDRAQATARVLVLADRWALASHGLMRLPVYLDRIAAGGHPSCDLEVTSDTGPLVALDGGGGLGHWQLTDASRIACERAAGYGIAGVALANSGHCGALGVYASDIAAAGLVGLVFSCGPAVLPPWGGSKRLLSTSPLAAGFPAADGPVIVDLAMSTVARGKIAAHAQAGTLLPQGWALDAQGAPTTDPHEALRGMLAPLGGAKGYALAFMVEALAAGLAGPLLSSDVPDFFATESRHVPQRIGHLVISIDPRRLGADPEATQRRLNDLVQRTGAAGGRPPGARRTPPEDVLPEDIVELNDDLWQDLQQRLRQQQPGPTTDASARGR